MAIPYAELTTERLAGMKPEFEAWLETVEGQNERRMFKCASPKMCPLAGWINSLLPFDNHYAKVGSADIGIYYGRVEIRNIELPVWMKDFIDGFDALDVWGRNHYYVQEVRAWHQTGQHPDRT